MRYILTSLMFLATTAFAEERALSPSEFERLVTGQTLQFSNASGAYGAEEYLPDRRVRWSFLDGECLEGEWYASGSQICFVYDGFDTPQCWQFYQTGGRILARFNDDPDATQLYETTRQDEPLYCVGPKVGA